MGYEELSEAVNHSFRTTGDIRMTLEEIRKVDRTISFGEVWEMLGFKDYFDFYETDSQT